MGKAIKTKYSDVSHRIIKKPLKKEKVNKKPALITKPKNGEVSEPCTLPTDNVLQKPGEDVSFKKIELPQSVFNKLEFDVIRGSSANDVRLQAKGIDKIDLFFHDELTSSYVNYINTDLGFHIVDEISLEGLDGITIEAYWKRLTDLEHPLNINNDIKDLIWQLICKKADIEFYKLPEPRGVLDIYDRSKNMNTNIGVVIELAYKLPDIYPHNLINHPDVQGSCSTFDTRVEISSEVRELTLKHAEQKYDRSLVMVANQKLRNNALYFDTADPTVEHQNLEYCVLERIGRSRKHGELTQGNMSIASHFKMDAKSVYHYKKQLIQNHLLGKQFFYIKSAVTEQNKTGRLLHIRRFFHKLKPKSLLIAEQIVNVMKTKPYNRIEYSEVRKLFYDNAHSVSKVIKSTDFHKFVKTDCLIPYRDLYPNAKMSEYMRKSKPAEKFLRCLKLIDPFVNIGATWANEQNDSDADDEDGEEGVIGAKIFNMECVKEVFHHILSKGKQGCTVQELQRLVGIDNNLMRMIVKKLLSKNVVAVEKFDKGKQRSLLYYARCLEDEDVTIRQNPDPPKLPNNVLAKIKQRQREAIEKTKLVAKKEDNVCGSTIKFPRLIETETPSIKCDYFIKTYIDEIIDEKLTIQAMFTATPREKIIKLFAELFNREQLFNINQVLCEIASNQTQRIKINFAEAYTNKTDINYIMKLILLKAVLGEVVINANSLNFFNRKRKLPVEMQVPKLLGEAQAENQKSQSASKLEYMGDNPAVIFKEKDGDINVEIIVSTPPAEFKYDYVYPETRVVSERVKTRIQIILDLVHERKIYEDMWKLGKHIQDIENKEGYTKKIDRKSLARILKKLVDEGYIKVFQLVLWDNKVTKSQQFVCHPSTSHTDSMIQSVSQQQKWKYFLGTQKKTVKPHVPSIQESLEKKVSASPFSQFDVMHSIAELKQMNKIKYKDLDAKYDRQMGRFYGFKPKFIRMHVMHEFLFYLIYEYDKETKPFSKDEAEELFKSYHIGLTEEELKKIPPIYSKEISWKTFIPPLPHHEGWIEGWALVCDVILRLPISVLCKVHNITYELPELVDVLKHPIKRFYLVKDLPESLRNVLLYKRKYLFTIHDSMTRLAYAGLLQFGPQKYKEKDQMFIYLNLRGSLLDTTSSEPSYHKVTDKEYRQIKFFFNTSTDIETYWYNAYGICLSTKLNAKLPGQLITLCDPSTKPELMDAVKSKLPEQAVKDDNGEIPGDKKGAGGFDSSLWSHIERNWFWAHKKNKYLSEGNAGLRKERLEKIMPQNLPYEELTSFGATSKVYLHKTIKEKEPKQKKLKKRKPIPLKPTKSIQKITRKIPLRPKTSTRQYYDHLDKIILKRIGVNTRVKWSAEEDKILMLCKAASICLNPRFPKKQPVAYTVLRDILHRSCPESKNKTSRACQRRIKQHVMESYPHLEEYIQNLFRIKPISDYYSIFVHNLLSEKTIDGKTFKIKDSQLSAAFVILMSYIIRHKAEVESVLQGNLLTIDHLSEDGLSNVEQNAYELEQVPLKYQDVRNEDDVKRDVLKSVVHSTLGSSTETGWTFQLLRIYQKYSDNLIRDAVTELKHSQMVSLKKFMTKKTITRAYMPFQLSNMYFFSLGSTFSVTTAIESYKTFLDVRQNKKFVDVSQEAIDTKKYGQLLGLNEFCTIWDNVRFKFCLPQSTVILNPNISDHSELVNELAVRWQAKMKRLQQENVEAEQESDPDKDSSKPEDFDIPTEKEPATTSQPYITDIVDDIQHSPLNLTVDSGSAETINRLKTWVTDCMETERERRSPSPQFVTLEESADIEIANTEERISKEPAFKSEEVIKTNLNPKKPAKDQIPTLEEIKEGMLEPDSDDRERTVPYITELSSLLNREYFTEIHTDEKTTQRLKNHFIMQYAVLEEFVAEELEQLNDFYMMECLQNSSKNKKIWERLQNNIIIQDPEDTSDVFKMLAGQGATDKDIELANDIIEFVFARNVLGATGIEIKKHFKHLEQNCTLECIIKVLTDSRIFIRAGICTITFVHHRFQSTWLIETFTLSHEEQKVLEADTAKLEKDITENIDKKLDDRKLIRIQVAPWIKIDGTLNKQNFQVCLCSVLSHCLDCPKILFTKLCEKFCFLKPVDIYFLLEILQELGCLELCLYDTKEKTLFSPWETVQERHATCLDNLEDAYVETSNVSMTLLGSFFYETQSE